MVVGVSVLRPGAARECGCLPLGVFWCLPYLFVL